MAKKKITKKKKTSNKKKTISSIKTSKQYMQPGGHGEIFTSNGIPGHRSGSPTINRTN